MEEILDRGAVPHADVPRRWDQQEAKAKFSELIRCARSEGPQIVTTRGVNPVVVLSEDDYLALTIGRPMRFSDLLLPGKPFEPARADVTVDYTTIDL